LSRQITFFADDSDQDDLLAAADAAGAVAVPSASNVFEDVKVATPRHARDVARHGKVYLVPKQCEEIIPILYDQEVEGTDMEWIDSTTSPVIELLLSGEHDGTVEGGRLYVNLEGDNEDVRRLYDKLVRLVRKWPSLPSSDAAPKGARLGPHTLDRVQAGDLALSYYGQPVPAD